MTFKFIGEGGGAAPASGGNVALWLYKTKTFTNTDPSSGTYFQIWDPNDARFPEPDSAHILFYTVAGWMKGADLTTKEDHPASCGAAFGYMKWLKGSIPQKIYGWRGLHSPGYPYDYTDLTRYSGFGTSASTTGAWLLPNPTGNHFFTQTDFIAPDAVNNAKGGWTKVFNGGNGHWWDRSSGLGTDTTKDAPGSNGSIFGPGQNGAGRYPSGLAGPGTTTARGSADVSMSLEVMDELGPLRFFIKGKAYDGTDPDKHADEGNFLIDPTAGMLVDTGIPVQWDATNLKLGTGMMAPGPRDIRPTQKISFNVILEYKG